MNKEGKNYCLNCKSELQGEYCHDCGQKDKEFRLSFWKLIKKFFDEITFFDNKIFNSIKLLFYQPSKMTNAFLEGKRMQFVPPFRLYLFLSSLYFLISFSASDWDFSSELGNDIALSKQMAVDSDIKSGAKIALQRLDSISASEPEFKNSWTNTKGRQLIQKYQSSPNDFLKDLSKEFTDRLPYLLYLSLPIIAFILWLINLKSNHLLFVDHFIFTLVLFSGFFFYLILFHLLGFSISLFTADKVDFDNLGNIVLFVYSYVGLKSFYQQGYFKTFFKFLTLQLLAGILILLIALGFIAISIQSLAL